jgi:hypothetical protein
MSSQQSKSRASYSVIQRQLRPDYNQEQAMVVDQIVQQIQPPTSLAPTETVSQGTGFGFRFDDSKLQAVVDEMEHRRKEWLKEYKTKLDLNDVLEIRNP